MLTKTVETSTILRATAQYGITNYSTATPKSNRNDLLVRNLYQKHDPLSRSSLLLSGSIINQFLFFDQDGALQVFTKPTPASKPTFESIIIGSRSDDFDMCIPYGMDTKASTFTFIGITTNRIATSNKWTISPTCPVTTEGPDPEAPPGAERIGMPYNDENDKPVIVEVPLLVPIPHGHTFPTNISLTDTDDISTRTSFTPLADWWKVMRHAFTNAKAQSLTAPDNGLFDPTAIDVTNFSNCKHDTLIGTEIDYIDPNSNLGQDMIRIIRAFKYQLCCNIIANDPVASNVHNTTTTPTATNPTHTTATPSPVNLEAALKAAVKTSAETEKEEDKANSVSFYRILFGRTKYTTDIDTGRDYLEFVPATLTDEFDQFLGTSKISRATTRLQDQLTSYEASIMNSDRTQDTNCHFETAIIDSFFTTQLQHGNWASKQIIIDPMGPETQIGIHHFAPCDTTSSTYKITQANNLLTLYQEQVGEDKSKVSAKRTKLFTKVSIKTLSDIEKMISTFLGFINSCIITNSNEKLPDIMTSLMTMAKLFRKEEAKVFEQRCITLPGIIFMLAQECQNIVISFVTEAKKLAYKKLVINNQPLPGNIFDTPLSNTKSYVHRILDSFNTGDVMKYQVVSATFEKLFNDENKSKKESDTKQYRDDKQQSNPRIARHRIDNPSPTSSDTNKGIIQWTNTGKMPNPPGSYPHPRDPNQKSPACVNFMTKGKACRYGKKCNFFHIYKPNDIPTTIREKFRQWVEDTDGISWAEGVTPPATSQEIQIEQYLQPTHSFTRFHSDQQHYITHTSPELELTNPNSPTWNNQKISIDISPKPDIIPATSRKLSDEEWLSVQDEIPSDVIPIPSTNPFPSKNLKCEELCGKITPALKKAFSEKYLPTKVQLQLNNPFGKDNLSQCFSSETVFRHTWILLVKSKYLSNSDKKRLSAATPQFRTLLFQFRKYEKIDFSPLRLFNPNWNNEEGFVQHRIDMTSAALLHYDGDVASVIRYVGGTHTYADIEPEKILQKLKNIISPETWNDMHRLYTAGCPSTANIQDTEKNYQAFRRFGNHAPAAEHANFLRKALVKTSKRSLMLMADDTLADFCHNVKFSPLSVVDTNHRYRKPRPITDCSNRPEPWCEAVNDWTSKDNEPKITFGTAFIRLLIWCYNLAISFPKARKAAVRDDITNAFPRLKHHPNVAGMYSTTFDGYWCINTSQTFGENTSPSGFDISARAREEASTHRWHQPTVIQDAKQYIPDFPEPKPMTIEELQDMTVATADDINKGILDVNGQRKPPPFCHHVDDNMYGDLASQFARVLSASVLGAYDVFGYPHSKMRGPDPIEWTKVVSDISHIDEPIGYGIDLHRLKVYLPVPKRNKIAEIILPWITTWSHCTLRQAAELVGSLIHAVQTNHIIKARFFGLQNLFRYALRSQFHKVKAWYGRQNKLQYLKKQLPPHLMQRLSALVSRDVAKVLWNSKTNIAIRSDIKAELQVIYNWISDTTRPWEIPMGHLIPRSTTVTSIGDASESALGAYSTDLSYWFGIVYGDDLYQQIKKGKIHINSLEFTTIILQIAAYICFIESKHMMTDYLNNTNTTIFPSEPVLEIHTDNQVSKNWAAHITARSEGGQNLVELYSYLLQRTSETKIISNYLAGKLNTTADIISRPPQPLINPPPQHIQQIYLTQPKLRHSHYFHPSAELLSNLSYLLRCEQKMTPIYLPQNLGQFSPVGTTILYSVLS